MAKYYIPYTCGHDGEREVQLVGPGKDRERKIEWFSRWCLCPACYRAEQERARQALGIIAQVRALPAATPAIMISLHGATEPIKDEAKARGYRWGELPAGSNIIFGTLGMMRRAPMGWSLVLPASSDLDALGRKVAAELVWIKSIPGLNIEKSTWISQIDIDYLHAGLKREADAAAAAAAKSAWLAANLEPQNRKLRQILGVPNTAKWNGKWYGKNERRVYIDGKEHELSAAQKAEWAAGVQARKMWRDAAAASGIKL